MDIFCKHCGDTFSAINPNQIYCSVRCRMKAFRTREAAKRPAVYLVCAHCDQPFAAANNNRRYKYCSQNCQIKAYRVANREYLLSIAQISRYGKPLPEIREELWEKQYGKCYLCKRDLPSKESAVVDHDHRCCRPAYSCEKCRRGLTCIPCNSLIGRANDDPDYLRHIADNLEKAQMRLNLGSTATL